MMTTYHITDKGAKVPDREGVSKRRRKLTAAPIRKTEFPALWRSMQKDGIFFDSTIEGYTFRVGVYEVSNKEIARVWDLSQSAMSRFIEWLLDGRPT